MKFERNRRYLVILVFLLLLGFYFLVQKQAPVMQAPLGDCDPNTYYIDYELGDDSNDGLCQASAWKHSPGDPNALLNPLGTQLQPGDTVAFKGGVKYYGDLTLAASGTSAGRITYLGNEWGTGKAIIDGSNLITTSWTNCLSAADCGDNPNWQNIYYTTAPAGMTLFKPIYEGDSFASIAQDPNPVDPHYYDSIAGFHNIPYGGNIILTLSSITDPTRFTQTDPSYYNGSSIAFWYNPNMVTYQNVISFDPATDTIYFDPYTGGGNLYPDRDGKYSILNHLGSLDSVGESSFNQVEGRVYLWPKDVNNLNDISVANSKQLIDTYGHDYITIEGFKIQKAYGDLEEYHLGSGIYNDLFISDS
ncbi:hypothetical protein HN604_01915 [archaeon]|mgnify:CR=1 FL=1|jgi:hypothetical protein|nr:hypothetical protein [archaeon]MBT6182424.1 hypothetical protein [archaeon]MBT6606325.1 hypothetical protein [archaeon]MBT7251506.1 hypothetical protein [archaeon]MBT7660818.1 hypothetical protein [archaeon]